MTKIISRQFTDTSLKKKKLYFKFIYVMVIMVCAHKDSHTLYKNEKAISFTPINVVTILFLKFSILALDDYGSELRMKCLTVHLFKWIRLN